jgi:hypothetical protein
MDYDNLIFLHIPKNAGATLHPVLERHYGKRSRHSVTVPEDVEAFKQLPQTRRDRIRLLKGHMPFGLHEYLTGRSAYITLLRHPAERIVSHYYYVKRMPKHYLHNHIAAGMSLAEFASAGISGEMDNGQVRLLSGHDQDIPCGECTPDLLDTAKRNIENHFAAVGLKERYDESLALMSMELGWNWTPYYLSRNITKNKPVAKQIDPATLKAIESSNTLDFELYDWVVKRFQAQIEQRAPEMEARVARLKRLNELYRPWGSLAETIKCNIKSRLMARAGVSA